MTKSIILVSLLIPACSTLAAPFKPASSTSTQAHAVTQSHIIDNTISAPNGQTHIITKSGRYFLAGYLTYQPQASNPNPPYSGLGSVQPIISVQANNVTIDLSSFVIASDNSTNTSQLCRAIDIGTSSTAVSNILITNGCIDTMSENGIVVNPNCTNITISNMQINNCGDNAAGTRYSGIGVSTGTTNVTINNVQINSCTAYGILFGSSCSNLYIDNLQIDSCSLGGIYADTANNLDIANTSITGSTGNSSNDAIGLYLSSSNFVSVLNCSFSQNISSAANAQDANGVYLTDCNNCLFEDCYANQNGCGDVAASAYGFKLSSSTACYFKRCQGSVNGNFSSANHALNAFGFYVSGGTDNHFEQCQALTNAADNAAGTAAGFYFSGTTNNECKDCEARDSNATGSAGTA